MNIKTIRENNRTKTSNTFPTKLMNFPSEFEAPYDDEKYNMTKINTVINNNPFKIILINKKNKKKYSFSNCSGTNSLMKERHSNKEIKSEINFDESREKLQDKINGLFMDKSKLRKISQDDINLEIRSENNEAYSNKAYKIINKNKNNINSNNNNNNDNENNDKTELDNKSITHILSTNNNNNNREEDLSQSIINENIKVSDLMNKCNSIYNKKNQKDNDNDNDKNKNNNHLQLKVSRSFSSLPCKLVTEEQPINNNENESIRKKSIISQEMKNNKESIFSSLNNDVYFNENKKEYNFIINKEKKKYKNIKEIKDDKNYFRILYLSSNLLEIVKNKTKYQLSKNVNNNNNDTIINEDKKKENQNIISDLNNQNYYIQMIEMY